MNNKLLKEQFLIFDLESTGLSIENDRIIEFGSHEMPAATSTYFQINPEIPIAPDATKKHGIKNEDLIDKKTFSFYKEQIQEKFENNKIIIGYNILNYDLPLLKNEFKRNGVEDFFKQENYQIIDLLNIVQFHFRNMESNRLDDVYEKLFDTKPLNSHNAIGDVLTTKKILETFIEVQLISEDVDGILHDHNRFKKIIDLEKQVYGYWLYLDRQTKTKLRLGAGKYRGELLENVDKKYLVYIVNNFGEKITEQTMKEFNKFI